MVTQNKLRTSEGEKVFFIHMNFRFTTAVDLNNALNRSNYEFYSISLLPSSLSTMRKTKKFLLKPRSCIFISQIKLYALNKIFV